MKSGKHVENTITLCRDLKLSLTPLVHHFKDHIIYQMRNIFGDLVDKTEGDI